MKRGASVDVFAAPSPHIEIEMDSGGWFFSPTTSRDSISSD